ncbi:MAG TPA: hypothetical protein VFX98_10585 [Longimicrobiaceae bacterium]|nr:hypothetical protein [Longimicrobiaceae bacterium]
MTTPTPAALVRNALEEADRRDRQSRLALTGAAVVEAALLGLALYLIDFDDRTHLLMLVLAVLTYTTLALGMMALAAKAGGAHARLLHAIQLLDERAGS